MVVITVLSKPFVLSLPHNNNENSNQGTPLNWFSFQSNLLNLEAPSLFESDM